MTNEKEFNKAREVGFQSVLSKAINCASIDTYLNQPDYEIAHIVGTLLDEIAKVRTKDQNDHEARLSRLSETITKLKNENSMLRELVKDVTDSRDYFKKEYTESKELFAKMKQFMVDNS
jgi:TRAP-type mannitol/chloroaromatic compound transport system substrate-binding protein